MFDIRDGCARPCEACGLPCASEIILATPGINYAVAFAGFSGATLANSSNAGAIFVGPKPFEERLHGPTANELIATLQHRFSAITDADIFVIPPPPVQGLGTSGGFKVLVQDRAGRGAQAWGRAYISRSSRCSSCKGFITPMPASRCRTQPVWRCTSRLGLHPSGSIAPSATNWGPGTMLGGGISRFKRS